MSRIRWSESRYRPTRTDESHGPHDRPPAQKVKQTLPISESRAIHQPKDHNDVTDQKATKRDADIDIGFRPFTDISVQKNK